MFNAVIAGNIGKDAETRSAGGSNVTNFNVAVEQHTKGGKVTTWVRCALWGNRGDKLAQYLTKGSKVCVAGELTSREYEGKTYLEINASDVTLMGGKPSDSGSGDNSGGGYGGGGRPNSDMDDEIPFFAEWRI